MSVRGNHVGWFEIYVKDMDRAKNFYETVLQCQLQRLVVPDGGDGNAEAIGMWAFDGSDDAYGAMGALVREPGFEGAGNNGGTVVYFSCADCAEEEGRVVAAGGSVFRSKFAIGEFGFAALVHDTEGNLIGLHSLA